MVSQSDSEHGTALLTVLVVITVVTIMVGLLLRTLVFQDQSTSRYLQMRQSAYLAEAGFHHVLEQFRTGELPMDYGGTIVFKEDTCSIIVARDGLYMQFTAQVDLPQIQRTYTSLVGYQAGLLFPEGLALESSIASFVVSRGSILQGDLTLNGLDIHYSPPNLIETNVITGTIVNDTSFALPHVTSYAIQHRLQAWQQQLDQNNAPQYTFQNNTTITPDVFLHDSAVVTANCQIKPASEFTPDTLQVERLYCSGDLTFGGDLYIPANTHIYSAGNIVFQDSVRSGKIFVYGNQGIFAQNQADLRGQFIARQQILLTHAARVGDYAVLLVPSNQEHLQGEPEIGILESARFGGVAFVVDTEASDEIPLRSGMSTSPQRGKITVDTSQPTDGGFFVAGDIDISGVHHGFIAAQNLVHQINRTTWWNNFTGISLLRYRLPYQYPIPPLFTAAEQLSLLTFQPLDGSE